ncbi:uncharacterized protein CTHT_0001030 [Thermochaetoides thermophila DSM 1495]|uniref:Thioredoxin domain-containing protein n=1 Tax=Chaetomium thermophilum (strain DSM 1495 / CBS 144.50 / IMI 039719) TaxID=759272 RepID=G0RYY6_CHATD|nr:hypothetical protein CTHT_0001030 [Thermochaetoides thermophila DSM 1495]EGS23414.1 hypothetical protein CTHT_0001030 [Thermochaetoides thermophila DSM 1495]
MATYITSSHEFSRILTSHTVVIADFYADWCGPCQRISPIFDSLAKQHSKPSRLAFVKINVDTHQDIAQQYGVRAMPTFKIINKGGVVETIQGANPPELTAAVERAVRLAGAGKGAAFAGEGRRLGGSPIVPRSGGRGGGARSWDLMALLEVVLRFVGLYFWTLFSLDPYKAAENSPFNVNRKTNTQAGNTGATKRPAGRPAFKTLADLKSE